MGTTAGHTGAQVGTLGVVERTLTSAVVEAVERDPMSAVAVVGVSRRPPESEGPDTEGIEAGRRTDTNA
jgi:hypothetical protein